MNEEEKDLKEQVNQVPSEAENAPEDSAVVPEETETESAPAEPSARQKALERLRSRKADREIADDDDEAIFGAINDDYDEDNAELEGYRGDAERWNEFLGSDYKAAAYLDSWQENGSPTIALVEEYGEDIMADIQNPVNKQKIKDAETKRLAKLAKQKELDDEYNTNIEASKACLEQMKSEGTYTPEQIDGAVDYLKTNFMKFLVGQIDADMITAAIKAQGYDNDVADAETKGETKGRNANIARDLAARKDATDGIPALGGGAAKQEQPEGETQRYGRKQSMWG